MKTSHHSTDSLSLGNIEEESDEDVLTYLKSQILCVRNLL